MLNASGKTIICVSHEQNVVSSICKKAYVFTKQDIISEKLDINEAYELYN